MNKKFIFTWFIWTIIFSLLFWYTLVFAWTTIFDNSINILFKTSNNIYLDSTSLNKNRILFKSWIDLSNYKLKSECNIFSKLTYSKSWYYMFDIKFFDNYCENENFILSDDNSETKFNFTLNIFNEYKILSKLIDLKTIELSSLRLNLDQKIQGLLKYKKYDNNIEKSYYVFLKKNRELEEAIYNMNIINNILDKRSEKYIVPVLWHKMPIKESKIPNSWRPYRKDYTNWIHQWWDIDGKFWEQVIALDSWIIVRVVSNFVFSDLNKIVKWNNLTEDNLIRNLDILRGNQVWLKTMSWDLVMYSHLNDIFSNIKIWEVVKKWQPLWTIWITWIPDEHYDDYHLHFEVYKNPFNLKRWESYDLDDYMRWNWLFQWKTKDYILENQLKYFE